MENKYYTPAIEEFHIGFEYEWKNSNEDNVWHIDEGADLEDVYHAIQDISQNLEHKEYRVRELDKLDFEVCGWTFDDKNSLKGLRVMFENEYHNRIHEDVGYMYWKVKLMYFPDRRTVTIRANVSDGTQDEKFFEGLVKNKSELKRVMRQLNIKLK